MPTENNFQHDELSRKSPGERLTTTELVVGAQPGSAAWTEAIAEVGGILRGAGVRTIVFLHGSIQGTDVFGVQRLDEVGGLKRGYSRGVSGLDALLAAMREGDAGIPGLPRGLKPPFPDDDSVKTLLDEQLGDAANFSGPYLNLYRTAINKYVSGSIVCERVLWSSEHHHLGRAVATVRLLEALRERCGRQGLGKGDRILVLAHGQAGLLLALASNLLCPSPITGRPRFVGIVGHYAAQANLPDAAAAARRLESFPACGSLLNGATLDVVTMGTPVRYGWDPSGIGKLLHMVNHRTLRTDGKTWLAKMELPQITMEMPIAWGGDYVQQLAVAGSDSLPPTEQAQAANKALWEMVEPYEGFERWLECARRAVRFPGEGRCLSVDYKDCTGSANVREHCYGHAAYTRLNAMLFTTQQLAALVYGSP